MTPSRPQPHLHSNIADFSLSRSFHPSLADATCEGEGIDHPANLSPNTIESNQAPSLVSDDEDDYEVASDSDSTSSSEAGDQDQDFRHIEVEDDERNAAPSAAAEAKPGPSLASPAPQPAPTLSKPLKKSRSKNISMMPFNGRGQDERMKYVHPEDPSQRNPGRNPSPTP
jgi:ADA HAT complex component 1